MDMHEFKKWLNNSTEIDIAVSLEWYENSIDGIFIGADIKNNHFRSVYMQNT